MIKMSDLLSVLQASFARYANSPAIILASSEEQKQVSFSELWQRGIQYTNLVEEHYDHNQVVPLYLSRGIDCLALMLACVMTGRVFSVINNRVTATQIDHILEQTKSRAIWIDGTVFNTLKKADSSNVKHLVNVDFLLLKSESWLSIYDKQLPGLQRKFRIQVIDPSSFDNEREYQNPPVDLNTPGACLYTSGSTGDPKGVLVSNFDLVARAVSEIESFRLKPGHSLLNILPWSFDVGLSQVLSSWVGGCSLVVLNSWLPADIVDAARRYKVFGISAVPSIWIDFLQSELAFLPPLPNYVTISGGSLTGEKQELLIRKMEGIAVIRTYGQTETCRSAIAFPEDIKLAPNSVGGQYAGVRLYIVDEKLKSLPTGEQGEILHSGDGVMLGYVNGDTENKRIKNPFFGHDKDVSEYAICTGDHGLLDCDGRLYLLGRSDDMVKIQGNRVYLAEIAAEAEALPEILEALPMALDGNDGQELVLYVVLFPDLPKQDESILRKKLAKYLPNYMLPKRIIIIDELPRTANGKTDKKLLRSLATKSFNN